MHSREALPPEEAQHSPVTTPSPRAMQASLGSDDCLWTPPASHFQEAPSPAIVLQTRRRRRIAGAIVGVITISAVLGAISVGLWLVITARNFGGVLAVAGTFSLAASIIAVVEIAQHLNCYTRPTLQKQVLRVLLMIPVYAASAFISLALPRAAPFVEVSREVYEAVVIYSFVWFVMTWLELDANMCFSSWPEMLASKPPLPHLWPFHHCVAPWPMGTPFIRHVQTGVLNYVAVRPVTAVIGFILTPVNKYTPGDLSPDNAYVYLAFMNSVAQAWALYCMVALYRVAWQEMTHVRVLAKFLAVKGIVFATFWQSILIAMAIRIGVLQRIIKPHGHDTEAEYATRIQNWLVCVEVLFLALAHSYAFSAREFWTEGGPAPKGVFENLNALLDWSDLRINLRGQVSLSTDTLADGVTAGAAAVVTSAVAPLRRYQQSRRSRAQALAVELEADEELFADGRTMAALAHQAQPERGARRSLLPSAGDGGTSPH